MGRGSSGKTSGTGKKPKTGAAKKAQEAKAAVSRFAESMNRRDADGMMSALRDAPMTVTSPTFTKNGNAISLQAATITSGDTEISLRFYNGWEPTAQTPPERPISIKIEAVVYKNGNVQAIRTLTEKKTKSLKNAAQNYQSMFDEWKWLTRQKEIRLD